jgi:hypothetical protein
MGFYPQHGMEEALVHRSAEEKRRIVEATFAPGTSIARVAREHGVNSEGRSVKSCLEFAPTACR